MKTSTSFIALTVILVPYLWANAFASDAPARSPQLVRTGQPGRMAIEEPKSDRVIRQDLFDRRNPMNIRSNWPSPPAQPGQF